MRNQHSHLLAATALLFVAAHASSDTVIWEQIPGAMSAHDMSPDGRWVVGELGEFSLTGTYLYDTVTDTMLVLPPEGIYAKAVSDDGTVVLGDMPDPDDPDPTMGTVAGMWTAATGWQSLGYLPNSLECPSRSDGYELSADGSVAVGLSWDGCNGRGFVWTQATGMLELEPLANGNCRASVVSADGQVIGGFAQGSSSRTPCIWDAATQDGELLDPPYGDALGEIHGVSDDGTILLGEWLTTEPITRAVKWTLGPDGWEREQIGGGSLLPGWSGNPLDIADDGTIVGFDSLMTNRIAWIQPGGTGDIIFLEDYINDNGGYVPPDEDLHVCQAISTDGRTIVGHSWPMTGGWIVRVYPDCAGDLDGDGDTDQADLGILLAAYQQNADGDLDGDGDTDQADLGILLADYDCGT
ncbi:MAG: hypothetical protein KAS72_13905 [Phycisphaerales bacterium]|nr:hypothetical protein [Phycisphaerales bacterium]